MFLQACSVIVNISNCVTTPSRKRIKNTRLARSKVFVQGLFSLRITKVLEFLTKGKLQVKSTLRQFIDKTINSKQQQEIHQLKGGLLVYGGKTIIFLPILVKSKSDFQYIAQQYRMRIQKHRRRGFKLLPSYDINWDDFE